MKIDTLLAPLIAIALLPLASPPAANTQKFPFKGVTFSDGTIGDPASFQQDQQ